MEINNKNIDTMWVIIVVTFLVELFMLFLILTGNYKSPLCL